MYCDNQSLNSQCVSLFVSVNVCVVQMNTKIEKNVGQLPYNDDDDDGCWIM